MLWKQIPERYRIDGAPDAWAAMRTDTGAVLGLIGENDEPVQNRDAFAFFDPLVAAGSFGNGERIWIMARLHGFMSVHGKDIVGRYLLLSHNCAGKVGSGIGAELSSMRVTGQIDAMQVSGTDPFKSACSL